MSQTFLAFEAVIAVEWPEKTGFRMRTFSTKRKNTYGGAAIAARALKYIQRRKLERR